PWRERGTAGRADDLREERDHGKHQRELPGWNEGQAVPAAVDRFVAAFHAVCRKAGSCYWDPAFFAQNFSFNRTTHESVILRSGSTVFCFRGGTNEGKKTFMS